jgi:4-diphosphocytidyl-2-C-methyl-D-erythritol kinase
MTSTPRRARVDAFAKINRGLKVLNKRTDGYHELRTVFQTVSLADRIDIEFRPARRTRLELDSSVDIADNLVLRAARMALDAMRCTGEVHFRLHKRIPMGAGLGGGSSDAAAVLLALPALAGRPVACDRLIRLAAEIGSDVPFFLLGGAALGVGRGTEIYPLPDAPRTWGVLVAPGIHVSTPDAYRALGRTLTIGPPGNMISSFESCVWRNTAEALEMGDSALWENDFEEAVFRQHPRLKSLKKVLFRMGARPALLTGSGSALFGIFRARVEAMGALPGFQKERAFLFSFVSRAAFRARWRRCLGAHADEETWPPTNRAAT